MNPGPNPARAAGDSGEVRSLVRGLNVLIAVNESPPATVTRIVEQTALPKATVVRLLATLRNQGFVAPDPHGRGYLPLPRVRRLASALMVENPFLQEARRRLIDFGNVTSWPSDLLLEESGAMLIVASNRDTAPIKLDRHEQRRFPLLDSAAGFAYLADLPVGERERAIDGVVAADADQEKARQQAKRARLMAEEVARRGYSVRDYTAPIEGTRVLGVGIRSEGRAIGALALITLREAVSGDQVEGRLVPAMREQAEQIGEQYALLAPDRQADHDQAAGAPSP